jgi:sensor histidine kinase regulating citrate/malate metabolism
MNRNYKIKVSVFCVLAILVLVAGVFGARVVTSIVLTDEQNSLLQRSGTIAIMVPAEELATLSGTKADLQNPFYQQVKEQLTAIRALNQDVRFAYIMGLRDGKQFFYVDSEDPSSEDYSYPGQPYEDAEEDDIASHSAGQSYAKGPYTDAWGEWYSGFAPVKDAQGKTLGMVGLDIAAEKIALKITIVKYSIASLTGLFLLSLVVMSLFAWRKP